MLHTLFQAITTGLVLALVTAVLSLLLTKCLLWLLPRWGMVDKPDFKRHIHVSEVPRGGGLAIILSFAIVALVFFGWAMRENAEVFKECLRFLAPCAILLPLGVCDDKFGLLARTKFFFQILAACLAWWLGFRLTVFFGLELPQWSCLILTVLWIVGFINAFNMIDGVDGLAAGVGVISAVCMGSIALSKGHFGFATVLLIFTGASLGFLYYNWHPAKVFMGDTGSMFIGYVLAVAGLMLNARLASVSSIGIPLLACGIPVIDMLCAVWRRLLGNQNAAGGFPPPADESHDASKNLGFIGRFVRLVGRLGTADQKHLHHRLLAYFNRNQRKTVWSIYLLALVMGGAGILCCVFPQNKVAFTLVILLCTFGFIINRLAFIELWQTTELAYHDFQSARVGVVITYFINPLADLFLIVLAYYFAAQHRHLATEELLRYIAILMAVLLTSRSYRVFWNFAVSDDYFRLIRTLIAGFILARASDVFLPSHHVTRLHSYAACVAISLIMLERLGLHFFRNWQAQRFSSTKLDKVNSPRKVRTLLYGVSPLTRFYRNRVLSDIEHAGDEELVGIVAIERRFLHSYCFGLKVVGTIDDLGRIVALRHINKIVLTKLPPENELERLKEICQKNNLDLQQFTCMVKEL
ncbi:MAG: hypothetical protein IJT83_02390 [Victivallales bacterium]|nr:hypothetical protein [Victivallales bacterium]